MKRMANQDGATHPARGRAGRALDAGGDGRPTARARIATAAGEIQVCFSEHGLCRLLLPGRTLEAALSGDLPERPLPRRLAPLRRALVAYFGGKRADPAAADVPLDTGPLTAFARRVYEALRQVPRGEVITYGELAARAGAPGAARAVGSLMARNRVPLVVPCHRVVASEGGLGGFSAPGGLETKRALLAREGALAAPGR